MSNRCVLLRGCSTGLGWRVRFKHEGLGFGTVQFFSPVIEGGFEESVSLWKFSFSSYGCGVIGEFQIAEDVLFAIRSGLETGAAAR